MHRGLLPKGHLIGKGVSGDRVELEVLPQMVSRAVWDQGGLVQGWMRSWEP